jgi:predicted nuclease of restriction endonuclease-like (RecB) superfamily
MGEAINLVNNFKVKKVIFNCGEFNELERIPVESRFKLMSNEKLKPNDLIPNPILIRNKNNIDIVTEKVLHQLILEDIESFMRELGNSFSFIGCEYKIKIGDRNHYIDLLLFNIKYNCYVVVELKVTEFKVEYIAQVQKVYELHR